MNQIRSDLCPEIVYEDAHLLVLCKEKEELTVPGRGADKAECLMSRAARWFGEVYNVHRLDQPTSGLIVIARSKKAQRELSILFQNRQVRKEYMATVRGIVDEDKGLIDLPLRADIENRPVQIVDRDRGKRAVTLWEVIRRGSNWTEMRLVPETGRTHQLRVHMKAMGHPIVGDRLYNDDTPGDLMGELKLHAWKLEFIHPLTGEALNLERAPDQSR